MKRILLLSLISLILAGCSQRISGRFELAEADEPTKPAHVANDRVDTLSMGEPLKLSSANRRYLEFDGSYVTIGGMGVNTRYKYRIRNGRVEFSPHGAETPNTVTTFNIVDDDTIEYMTLQFKRVKK